VIAVAFSHDGKSMLTGSLDGTARIWKIPPPLEGGAERINLWAQVVTGLELDSSGTILYLEPAAWKDRHERLRRLGGPPR
jgi:WD40 repeat protein